MTRPTKLEVNCETGEQTIIELTDEEIVQIEADRAAAEARQSALEADEQNKAEIKASAIAKLATLGLTEEEAQFLINR